MSLMLKNKKITRLSSLTVGAVILSIFLVPFSFSQVSIKKVEGTPAGWSDNIKLTDDGMTHVDSEIAVSGDQVHVIWEQHNPSNGDDYLVYIKSNDNGETWESMQNISDTDYVRVHPDIDSADQNVHVVWEDYRGSEISRIYYRNSTDGGVIWNPEKRISSPLGRRSVAPHVFVNDTNIHIIWIDLRNSDKEIYYRRSLDGGITFDNGQGLDEDRRLTFSPADMGGINIAGEGSKISAVWYDERNGDWDIYWMISKDNGYTWEDGLGNIGQDRRISINSIASVDPAIAINGTNIHVVWDEHEWNGPNEDYYLFYRNSTDNGVTWNTPVLLTGPVPLVQSPDIDVFGNDVSVVWGDKRDGGNTEVYYKSSQDSGISWSEDIRLTNDTPESNLPRISLNNDIKHVIWNSDEIYYKRYPDFPPDTSPPSHSNEIPYPDSYKDAPGTNVSVHVTDPSGVNESTIQLYVNGSLVSNTLTPITDGYNVSYESPGFEPGVVTCRIVADDNLSNHLDYTWNFTVLAIYEIPLCEGWNLVSVPLEQVDTSISEVLKDIEGKWDCIQVYNATDPDHWKTNMSYRPDQLNDLTTLNHRMGFWINVTEPNVNLTVRGNISTTTTIPLYAGWNLVGYPTLNSTMTVGNALFGTTADRVEVFNSTDPYRTKEVTSTYIMKPGEGYWVHVIADSIWTINW
jgi:hypothetical protein